MLERNAVKLADTLRNELPSAEVSIGSVDYPTVSHYVEIRGGRFGYRGIRFMSSDELESLEESDPSVKAERLLFRSIHKAIPALLEGRTTRVSDTIGAAVRSAIQAAEDALSTKCKGSLLNADCDTLLFGDEGSAEGQCGTCCDDDEKATGKACAAVGEHGWGCWKSIPEEDQTGQPGRCISCDAEDRPFMEKYLPFVRNTMQAIAGG